MGTTPLLALPYEDQAEPLVRSWPESLATKAGEKALALAIDGAVQPLDADLTAIAALNTLAYGRSLLTMADAATARGTLGAEATANKGANSGYMGLDAGGLGAQNPKLHAARHAKAGADALALGDIATVVGDLPSWLVDAVMPWRHEISPLRLNGLETGTWASALSTNEALNYFHYNVPAAQNDEKAWDLSLAAGTYRLDMLGVTFNLCAVASVRMDGTEFGTWDQYSSALTYNVSKSITGISVASTGKHRLSLKAATKNASSTGYTLYLAWLTLTRTA